MRQSIDTSWEKALKRDDFFESFRIPYWRIGKKKSKNVDFLTIDANVFVTIRKKHRSTLDKNVDLLKRSR